MPPLHTECNQKSWSVWHGKRSQGSNQNCGQFGIKKNRSQGSDQIAESNGRPDEQKPPSEIARKGINADLNCQGCIENTELKF